MSKNWGRTPITNADKLHSATMSKYIVNGEEVIDRRPLGKVERFVDPSGNIVSLQLAGDGDSQGAATIVRERSQLHRKGFVEFAKCPLKHGTRYASELARKDFAKMPKDVEGECKHDPKVMERRDGDLYFNGGCQHVEWLVKFRREKEAAALAKRNASRVAEDKRKAEKLKLEELQREMLQAQVDEFKAKKAGKTKAPE